ncbi:oxidoreductase domain protein [Pseudonocardia sp. Ae168_Ps1]|uniref:Gfo/Idh/MocA family protein n=1 Tax=unclassified Pseudonocardia TaxID=2619320 RepID=UPI00094AC9CD|nr:MULTISPECIES: Gfo/Idh/MocA family oxidoreductase [unclassified Pseudonocardia]OLL71710.1 oxidoreductase domain protein [Pseudonocardia sp. Ae150A_Ps1]OLL77685.1 oxidoreductase domain protein [Pseudonocardia sp. Ae168_Ps1]OLL88192.1 oxidoreductase domain protein [Pseudonocardia sp. Ae263_Ps1]OLL91778.1 oxidoreductase domain protein [Pseudonocardia sp. Ae356_Ps1]
MNDRPLRIGILGAARIAGEALCAPAAEAGDRLVAVAARDRGRAERFAAEHGVERVHDDYAAVLDDPGVEVVYNPLANALHGPWNLAAVAAGKHVLSEKPFASDAGEAREVAAAARAAGVTVVEGFHHVHHPVFRRLAAITGSGELGPITTVETTFRMPAPPDTDPRWSLDLAGGALMDLGCYALHIQRRLGAKLGGEPTVTAATARERSPGVDASVTADLGFPSGATGAAHCDMDADGWTITARVVGERGEAVARNVVLPTRDDRIEVRARGVTRTEHLGTRPTYTSQLEALRAHLRGREPFPLDLDDAVATAELIDAVYRAAGMEPRPRRAPLRL